jgi:hypothetical protein
LACVKGSRCPTHRKTPSSGQADPIIGDCPPILRLTKQRQRLADEEKRDLLKGWESKWTNSAQRRNGVQRRYFIDLTVSPPAPVC